MYSHGSTDKKQYSNIRLGGIQTDADSFYVNEDLAQRFCWKSGDLPEGGGGSSSGSFSDFRKLQPVQWEADLEEAVEGVKYIAEHMKTEDDDEGVSMKCRNAVQLYDCAKLLSI